MSGVNCLFLSFINNFPSLFLSPCVSRRFSHRCPTKPRSRTPKSCSGAVGTTAGESPHSQKADPALISRPPYASVVLRLTQVIVTEQRVPTARSLSPIGSFSPQPKHFRTGILAVDLQQKRKYIKHTHTQSHFPQAACGNIVLGLRGLIKL